MPADTRTRSLLQRDRRLAAVAQYESIFRLHYLRGPAGSIVALAEQIS